MVRSLLTLALLVVSSVATAQIPTGGTAPQFTLSDVNEVEFSTETARTQPLVVIFTTKDLGDFSLAWRDSLEADDWPVEIQTVLDLSDVSRFLRSIARSRIKDKGSVALLDWDGEVSQAWRGEDRSQVVVMVVNPANRVILTVQGEATREYLDRVISAVRADE